MLILIALICALVPLLGLSPFAFPVLVGALHLFVMRAEIPAGFHLNRFAENHVEIEDVSPEAVPGTRRRKSSAVPERSSATDAGFDEVGIERRDADQ